MGKSLSVLMIEDSEDDMLVLLHILEQNNYEVIYLRVETADDMNAALVRQNWDLILCDYSIPGFGAPKALSVIKEKGLDIPFIIVSGTINEETAVATLKTGAHDFILKERMARLIPAIEREIREAHIRQKQRQTETALRQSERRFRRLIDSNLFGIVFANCFGGLYYANDYFLNLLGYTLEEIESGQVRWDQLTPPEFAFLDAKAVEELTTQGVCAPYEKVYLHKNGQRIPVLIVATLLEEPFDENQEVIGFILDLTKLQQVIQERDRFFNLSIDMLAIINFDGYFTQVNPAWQKTLGFSEVELTTHPYLDFVHPEDRAATIVEAQKLAQGYETIGFENRYCTKDGSYRWISWNVASVPEQKILYAIARDITEKKQSELEQEQLLLREQAAREASEQANRLKDEFLAVLSHELRTPLHPILGWSRLLQEGKLNATQITVALETIERNAKLQTQLIDDLLDISRILRGKMSLDIMPIDLASVILAALETVRLAAQAKSLQIQTDFASSAITVNGDAARLQQVVWNLLSNAVKFTPKGGMIDICLTKVGIYAVVQIKDTGKGIEPNFLPYVFEHFRQEDGATTRKFGGLGLGLAIVRQIVEMHGGIVTADSPGLLKGATFTVQIPIFATDGEMPMVEELSTFIDLSGIEVLVVDDEPDSLSFIAFALEQEQAIVTTAASAFDALQILERCPSLPHVIISDIGMPYMDGYMLMREITRQCKDVKGIALTAYAGELDRQQALAAGFQQHLAKPVEIVELINAIAILVGRKSD